MVHGRCREEVTQKVAEITQNCGLQDIDHIILFSTRRFKQRGASYTTSHNAKHSSGHQVKKNAARLYLVKQPGTAMLKNKVCRIEPEYNEP
jgi:acyl CoA:acetate/3-ketoacid CoA transferase alpha subunit